MALAKARAFSKARLIAGIDASMAALTRWRASLTGTDLGTIREERGSDDELVEKIGLLIRLRTVAHVIVPAVLLLLQSFDLRLVTRGQAQGALWPSFVIAGLGLAMNATYGWLVRRRRNLRPIAHAQIWFDTAIFAVAIYNTGGISSPFTFLYVIPVLASSMLLSLQASVAVATFATALLGAQAWLQFHGVLGNDKYFEPLLPLTQNGGFVLATVVLNGLLYLLIALTTGVLSRTIRRHEAALERRANEATMLHEVSSSLQAHTELDAVLRQIMDTMVRRLDVDRALMYLVNDDGTSLDLKVVSYHPRLAGAPPSDDLKVQFPLTRDSGVTATCALEKKVFNVTHPLDHPLINREVAIKIGLNPFAVAPMLARGTVVGVLGCDRRFRKAIITQEEAQGLAIAANQAGLTIQNAELYDRFAGSMESKRIRGRG